jgi:hypothetical protein
MLNVSSASGEEGMWKVAPLRRDMLVLTVGRPDVVTAVDGEGVRAERVVFVLRRGLLNDMMDVDRCGRRPMMIDGRAVKTAAVVCRTTGGCEGTSFDLGLQLH